MCDVTFPPKSCENCYVTVHDYRRRFADPYYFEFGSGTQTRRGLSENKSDLSICSDLNFLTKQIKFLTQKKILFHIPHKTIVKIYSKTRIRLLSDCYRKMSGR